MAIEFLTTLLKTAVPVSAKVGLYAPTSSQRSLYIYMTMYKFRGCLHKYSHRQWLSHLKKSPSLQDYQGRTR